MLIASDDGKLNLLKSGKRPGKIDGFRQEGPSNALSLVFGPDVHAQDVASVLLPLSVYSAERHHSYQLFLTVGAKGEVVRRFCGQTESFGYEFQGVCALALVGGPECIRVFFQGPETQVLIVSGVAFVKGADCYVLHGYAVTVQQYADRALEQRPGRPLSLAVRSQRGLRPFLAKVSALELGPLNRLAQPSDRTSACSRRVCVAFSCRAGSRACG